MVERLFFIKSCLCTTSLCSDWRDTLFRRL